MRHTGALVLYGIVWWDALKWATKRENRNEQCKKVEWESEAEKRDGGGKKVQVKQWSNQKTREKSFVLNKTNMNRKSALARAREQ